MPSRRGVSCLRRKLIDVKGADLSGARLTNADLRGSDLSGANLAGADLGGTDLTGTNITQRQLDSACGSGARLPPGLRIRPCLAPVASGADAGGQRASADRAPPKARDDRATSSETLTEAPPLGMRARGSRQPSQTPQDLVDLGAETPSKAARR